MFNDFSFNAFDKSYQWNPANFHDLSFAAGGSNQRSCFCMPVTTIGPIKLGDWVGNIKHGASVNCEYITIYPHGNGTHAESARHILGYGPGAAELSFETTFHGACLIQVDPIKFEETEEIYPNGENGDTVLTKASIHGALNKLFENHSTEEMKFFCKAVIIRTKDVQTSSFEHKNWNETNPAYFTTEAIQFLSDLCELCVIVDLPSIDREVSSHVSNHHIFFEAKHKVPDQVLPPKLVVELANIPNEILSNLYLLNLQLSPIVKTDAVPCRPILYPIQIQSQN